MPDYEVREVMSRRKHPKLTAEIRIVEHKVNKLMLSVRICNEGKVIARDFAALIRFPFRVGSLVIYPIDVDVVVEHHGKLAFWEFTLSNAKGGGPLFPYSEAILRCVLARDADFHPKDHPTLKDVELVLYADEMEKVELRKSPSKAQSGWI